MCARDACKESVLEEEGVVPGGKNTLVTVYHTLLGCLGYWQQGES